MSPTAGASHDLTIASGGTTKGYMLYRGRNGKRPFLIQDAQTIAPRQLTMGEITEAEFPAELELTWKQENWQGGFGGINSRLSSGQIQLARGFKVDTSLASGIIQLANKLIATTADLAPSEYKPSGFAISGTTPWAFIGRYPYTWDYTNKNWDRGTVLAVTTAVCRNGVEFGDNTYVPRWTASTDAPIAYIYKASGDAGWTVSTLANATFKCLCVADNRLWGGNLGTAGTNVHQVKSSSDGTNTGSWSTAIAVGDSAYAITALVNYEDMLLICKGDGLWTMTASADVRLLYSMKSESNADNFQGAISWDNGQRVLLPLASGGMLELYRDAITDISFLAVAPDQTFLHGVVYALAADTTRVFALILETGNTRYNLVAGELVAIGGSLVYCWEHLGTIAYTTSSPSFHSALFAEGVPSGAIDHHRIHAGVESGGSNLLPYFYPLENDTELVFTPDDNSEADTVAWDANLPRVDKRYASIIFSWANLGSVATGHYIEVKYRVDGGSWTYVTGAQGTSRLTTDISATSPQTLTFASGVTGKKLELQFLFFQGDTTTTSPRILDFTVKAQLRPDSLSTIPLQLYLADNQLLLNGARETQSGANLTQLETWKEQTAEVTLVTPDETSYTCVFLKSTWRKQEVNKVKRRRAEYVVSCLLAEV